MLHTIRQVVGNDSTWRAVLRGLNATFAHQIVTGRQIQEYISAHAGVDLRQCSQQYLTTTKVPMLEYRLDGSTLTYRWADVVPGFAMPIRVHAAKRQLDDAQADRAMADGDACRSTGRTRFAWTRTTTCSPGGWTAPATRRTRPGRAEPRGLDDHADRPGPSPAPRRRRRRGRLAAVRLSRPQSHRRGRAGPRDRGLPARLRADPAHGSPDRPGSRGGRRALARLALVSGPSASG